MSTTYFCSDFHFRHWLVVKERGFQTVDEMNEKIIESYNSVVKDKDDVWILGDIGFGKFSEIEKLVKRLKGHKRVCYGNHDVRHKKNYVKSGLFEWLGDFKEIKINNQKISLMHYPILSFPSMRYGSYMIHGHQHCKGFYDPNIKRIDCGIDGRQDFTPYSFEEIKAIFDNPTDFKYYKHRE